MPKTLVGQVPSDWDLITLGEVCKRGGGNIQTGPFGSQLHASDYVSDGIPSVMPRNIGDNTIIEEGIARIRVEDAIRLKKYLLAPGDIVYSRRGDVERRALIRAKQAGWLCGTGCLRIRPGSAADPRFLAYYLGHPEVRNYIVRHAVGATMPNLNTTILSSVPVALPPRALQQAIGCILGALDDKIGVNERLAEALLRIAEAKYIQLVSPIPGWRSIALSDAARWLSGGTPRTSEPRYWNGHIPWISAASLKSPWIDRSDRNVTQLGAENGTRLVPAESVIFVVRGMSLKTEFRLGIAQREVAFGQDCKALIAADGIDPIYLFFSLQTRKSEILAMVDEAGHGTGRLPTERLGQLRILVPPPQEQQRIVDILRPLSTAAARRQAESYILAELRDTLLPKLISGELRIRDAGKVVEHTV